MGMNGTLNEITEERQLELLELLMDQVYKIGLQKTVQTYPPCSCGRTKDFIDFDYDFAPGKKGITVKVLICACGKRNYPAIEMVH